MPGGSAYSFGFWPFEAVVCQTSATEMECECHILALFGAGGR